MAPAVSVIVPVYNVAPYLPACLDSLLAQEFEDFEAILVDDGSTDGSSAVIDRYTRSHPHVFRATSKPNGGLSDARNHGMRLARGEYLAFVDADDIVRPRMLSALVALATQRGADLAICGITGFIDPANPTPYIPEPDMGAFGRSLSEEPRLLYRVDASACDKLFARELFERAGIEFPVGQSFEDVPTVYRLLAFAQRVEKVDEPLYLYRQRREGSITAAYGAHFLDLVAGFEQVDDFFEGRGEFDCYRSALLRLHLTHLIAGRYPDLFLRAEPADTRRFSSTAFELLDRRFPGWRREAVCRELWADPLLRAVSTRERLLQAFCRLPQRVYLGALARMGAFDASR